MAVFRMLRRDSTVPPRRCSTCRCSTLSACVHWGMPCFERHHGALQMQRAHPAVSVRCGTGCHPLQTQPHCGAWRTIRGDISAGGWTASALASAHLVAVDPVQCRWRPVCWHRGQRSCSNDKSLGILPSEVTDGPGNGRKAQYVPGAGAARHWQGAFHTSESEAVRHQRSTSSVPHTLGADLQGCPGWNFGPGTGPAAPPSTPQRWAPPQTATGAGCPAVQQWAADEASATAAARENVRECHLDH